MTTGWAKDWAMERQAAQEVVYIKPQGKERVELSDKWLTVRSEGGRRISGEKCLMRKEYVGVNGC